MVFIGACWPSERDYVALSTCGLQAEMEDFVCDLSFWFGLGALVIFNYKTNTGRPKTMSTVNMSERAAASRVWHWKETHDRAESERILSPTYQSHTQASATRRFREYANEQASEREGENFVCVQSGALTVSMLHIAARVQCGGDGDSTCHCAASFRQNL